MLFGVPFGEEDRARYRDARLSGYGENFREALDSEDRVLEIIASRASALAGVYSLIIAILTFFLSKESGEFAPILSLSILAICVSLALLVPILWISWAWDPKIYATPVKEYDRTLQLVFRRSTYFNCSIVIAVSASAASGLAVILRSLSAS